MYPQNVLQARNPATATRLVKLVRGRLETMGPDLWRLVKDGKGTVAFHAALAAAVKHSRLLGDFLDLVVREQHRLYAKTLSSCHPQGDTAMPTIMAIEDIKLSLPELLDKLAPGEEVILTRNQPVCVVYP